MSQKLGQITHYPAPHMLRQGLHINGRPEWLVEYMLELAAISCAADG